MSAILPIVGFVCVVVVLLSMPAAIIRRWIEERKRDRALNDAGLQRNLEARRQEAAYWREVERRAESGDAAAREELTSKRRSDYLAHQVALHTPPQPQQSWFVFFWWR